MSNDNSMPTYQYRPTNTNYPHIKTYSSIRARLFNDTYFRASDPGGEGNNISICIVQVGLENPKGDLYITNHNNQSNESITISNPASKVDVSYFDMSGLNFNEVLTLEVVSPTEIAITNTISLQIRKFESPTMEKQYFGIKSISAAFFLRNNVTMCIDMGKSILSVGDIITIKPRIEKYPLTWVSKIITSPEGGETTTYKGWDIDNLRKEVTARSKFVEMLPRAFADEKESARKPGSDIQDTGYDSIVMATFDDTHLDGGGGFPATPDAESTGESRSLIHINYGELYNGELGEVNQIYEWCGQSNRDGVWKHYA